LTGKIKERLLLNHINLTQNVFGVEASTRILFLRIEEKDWSALKTLLIFLSAMPKIVKGVRGKDIISSDIPLDNKLVAILRNLVDK
jgi:hypothetical protein